MGGVAAAASAGVRATDAIASKLKATAMPAMVSAPSPSVRKIATSASAASNDDDRRDVLEEGDRSIWRLFDHPRASAAGARRHD